MLQGFHVTQSRYDMESSAIIYPFQTQWLLHIAPPDLTIKTSSLCLQNMFIYVYMSRSQNEKQLFHQTNNNVDTFNALYLL